MNDKPELNHDDLFSFIEDETIIRYIASICGRLGVGKCTCIAIGDIVRKANGHPPFRDEREAGRQDEMLRVARVLAALSPSQAIATLAADLGIADKLDAAWDALHPEDAGKPGSYGQQEGLPR